MAINVLGPLVTDDGTPSLAPRDRVVLAALVTRLGQEVSVDALAGALWGEAPPASAAKVVQGCVVRLRRVLGAEAIRTGPSGYRLVVPAHDVDARRFERLLAEGVEQLAVGEPDRAAYTARRALDLWRGHPLPELEEWEPGRLEAERLTALRLQAEELSLEARIASGQHHEVLAEARTRVGEQPLRERRWHLLARAQYQSGLQADALATLRTAREHLLDELGLDPGPELVGLEKAILRQDPALDRSTAPSPSGQPPYPGLVPFDVDDAASFFGREREILECLTMWTAHGVLAVVGPSGSGKSSLVRAGVSARLADGGHRVVVMTPGARPLSSLETSLAGVGPRDDVVLVVDQAEELVTLCDREVERRSFAAALVDLAPRVRPVLAVSADRLGELAAYPDLVRLLEPGLYLLARLEPTALREVVEGPARVAGLLLEPGLVDVLVRDVAEEPGALPMLAHALRQTWERREGRTLTVSGYEASGGIQGAVAQSAEHVYRDLTAEERSALRDLLLRLVTPSPDREPVLTRMPRDVVAPDDQRQRIVERLVRARLLTRDQGAVEIAHASLVRAWPRLRRWLAEDLQGQLLWHHLTDSSLAWDASGRPEDELYRGARLAAASEWERRVGPSLTQVEREFLDAGRTVHQREVRRLEEEAARQRRSVRRLRALAAAVAVVALVATLLGTSAVRQADRADVEALRARAHELAASSLQAMNSDPGLGRTLAVAAAEAGPETPSVQTSAALHQALATDQVVARLTFPHAFGRLTADLHPDGDRVAMTSEWPDAGTRFVEVQQLDGRPVATLELPRTLDAASAIFDRAYFTPDGTELAAGVLWNPTHTGRIGPPNDEPPPTLLGVHIYDTETYELEDVVDVGACGGGLLSATQTHVVVYAAASPSCDWTLSEGRDLVLVARGSGERTVLAEGITNLVGSARLSADGRFVVHEDRAGGTREVVVRVLASGEEVARWAGDTLRDVSPDGAWVLQGLNAWTVREVATGNEVTFQDPRGIGFYADFHPDGQSLTTVTEDGTVSWWDVRTGERLGSHRGLRAGSVSVAADGLVTVADAAGIEVSVVDPNRGESGTRGRVCPVTSDITEMMVRDGGVHTSVRCEDASSWSHHRTDLATARTTQLDAGRVVWSDSGMQWRESVGSPPAAPAGAVNQLYLEVLADDARADPVRLGGMCPLVWGERGAVTEGCAPFPEQPFFLDPCAVAFSPDGGLVAAISCPGSSGGLTVWDTGSGELLHAGTVADPETGGAPTHLVFTPDGTELVVSTETGHVVVLDVDSWKVARRSAAPVLDASYMPVVGFLGGGDLVGVTNVGAPGGGADATLHVLNRESLVPQHTRQSLHEGTVMDAELSPDGSRVATAAAQGLVRLWDTGTLDLVHEIPVSQAVHAVAWLDDRRLVLLRDDGTLDTVLTDPGELIAVAREGLNRPLTTAECRSFGFEGSCPSLGQLRDGPTATDLDGSYVLRRRAEDFHADMRAGVEAEQGATLDQRSTEELAALSAEILGEAAGMRLHLEDRSFRVVRDVATSGQVEGAEAHCEGTYTVTGDMLRLDAERGTWCYLGLYLEARFSVEEGGLRLHADGFRGPVFERYLWGDQLLLSQT
ncbi:BTAD domain-containing putative transcriptional regulator [Ornithinimicrobium sp. W1679]|uniref:nSTAND1 domain-containing NTPase n=1 Tax=Ornithinimicrobium sp. W1679 TaxID=3418770 RepID=UPI003CEEAD4E